MTIHLMALHKLFLILPILIWRPTQSTGLRVADFELAPTASPFSNPQGVTVDPTNETLYVADTNNSRILIFYNIYDIPTGAAPDNVLGQSSISNTDTLPNRGSPQPSSDTLNLPQAVFLGGKTLFVADTANNRVLLWENLAALSAGEVAAKIIGQTSGATALPGSAAGNLHSPVGLFFRANSLWVADQQNSRVLRYDNPGTMTQAQGLLGQSDFPDYAETPCSATSLTTPSSVAVDAREGVYVSSVGDHRVVYFNASEAAQTDGTAEFVFGQTELNSCSYIGTTNSSMYAPRSMALGKNNALYVSDLVNNRVLLFPQGTPGSNDIEAVDILGQPTFFSTQSGNSMAELNQPAQIAYDSFRDTLWVADSGNNRILRFSNISANQNVPVQQLSSLNVVVDFLGATPSLYAYPKTSNGTVSSSVNLLLQPVLVEEVETNGSVVTSVPFPTTGFTVDTSVDGNMNQFFTFSLAEPFSGVVMYSLWNREQSLHSAGINFTVQPSSIKLEIQLNHWNFTQPSNTLRLHLQLSTQPAVTSIQSTLTIANITTFAMNSGNTVLTTINLLNNCVVDNSSFLPVTFAITNGTGSIIDLVLNLPHFESTLMYDPDFSVVLGGSGASGDGGGSGNLNLLALLSILVIPLVMFGFAAAAFIVYVLVRRRRQESDAGNVNFGPHDEEEEVL